MIKRLYTFNILNFKVDGGAMFGVVPKVIWSRYFEADNRNNISLALRSLVVETDKRIVLIDTGIGDKQDENFMHSLHPYGGDGLVEGLKKGGYKKEDVTDVILTHLHFDHCGGSLERNEEGEIVPVFPNATYHVSKQQWENAFDPNIREADALLPENIFPLQDHGVLNLIRQKGKLFDGLELRMANGHTPGQLIPVIRFKNSTLIYGADLFPTRAHVPVKYNMAYDLEVTQTMKEKELFLEEFSEPGTAILFEHDIHAECGYPTKTKKGFRVVETLTLDEWINAQ